MMSFLEELRGTWKPEHLGGESWTEEGSNEKAAVKELDAERSVVNEALIDLDDYLAVKINDLVRYIDILKPQEILQVRITQNTTDIPNGLISETTPLAQVFLGAVKEMKQL